MEVDIAQQGRTLLLSISLGLGGGLVYDLLRTLRLRRKRAHLLTHLLDGVFTGSAAYALLYLCVIKGGGTLRLYMVCGVVLGAVVWFALPGPYCRELWSLWVEAAAQALGLMAKPFVVIFSAMKKVGKKVFLFCGKYATMGTKKSFRIAVYRRRKGGRLRDKDEEKSAAAP